MTNQNQEAFEQMKRFTKTAKNLYGNNYSPGAINPQYQTKFFLNEDYIPFDFDTDYNDPLYKEYRRVRMLKNPFEDNQISTLNQIQAPVIQQKSRVQSDMDDLQSRLKSVKTVENNLQKYNDKNFFFNKDVLSDTAKFTGQGIISGVESALDGATLGGYGYWDKWYNNNQMNKRRELLDNQSNMAGLGKLNDMAHIGLNVIGGTLSGKSLSNPYKNVKNFLSSNNNLRDFYKQGISLYNKFKF